MQWKELDLERTGITKMNHKYGIFMKCKFVLVCNIGRIQIFKRKIKTALLSKVTEYPRVINVPTITDTDSCEYKGIIKNIFYELII